MASTNADRLERYKEKLREAGFKRLSLWVCQNWSQCWQQSASNMNVVAGRWNACCWAGRGSARSTGRRLNVPRGHDGRNPLLLRANARMAEILHPKMRRRTRGRTLRRGGYLLRLAKLGGASAHIARARVRANLPEPGNRLGRLLRCRVARPH